MKECNLIKKRRSIKLFDKNLVNYVNYTSTYASNQQN